MFNKYDTPRKYYDPLPHYHSSIEIYVVTRGEYIVSIGGDKRVLRAGEIAFVDRFVPHSSGAVEGCEDMCVYILVASSEYFSTIKRLEKEVPAPFTPRREGFENIAELMELGIRALKKRDEISVSGFVAMFLGFLYEYSDITVKSREKSASVCVDIMKHISEHYAERITLDGLAEAYGYERTYLSRLLNRALGMNLREYLNRVRVSAAINMRQHDPDISMAKIAEACGFESENTYYRAIKRYG